MCLSRHRKPQLEPRTIPTIPSLRSRHPSQLSAAFGSLGRGDVLRFVGFLDFPNVANRLLTKVATLLDLLDQPLVADCALVYHGSSNGGLLGLVGAYHWKSGGHARLALVGYTAVGHRLDPV